VRTCGRVVGHDALSFRKCYLERKEGEFAKAKRKVVYVIALSKVGCFHTTHGSAEGTVKCTATATCQSHSGFVRALRLVARPQAALRFA
jgi:hypothetical protein